LLVGVGLLHLRVWRRCRRWWRRCRERELDNKEGTIVAWEDGLVASDRAVGNVCMERDVERVQTEAVR
jgi:hypothetical protein